MKTLSCAALLLAAATLPAGAAWTCYTNRDQNTSWTEACWKRGLQKELGPGCRPDLQSVDETVDWKSWIGVSSARPYQLKVLNHNESGALYTEGSATTSNAFHVFRSSEPTDVLRASYGALWNTHVSPASCLLPGGASLATVELWLSILMTSAKNGILPWNTGWINKKCDQASGGGSQCQGTIQGSANSPIFFASDTPIQFTWGASVRAAAADQIDPASSCANDQATGAGGMGVLEIRISRNNGQFTPTQEFCQPIRMTSTFGAKYPNFPLMFSSISEYAQTEIAGNIEDVITWMPPAWQEHNQPVTIHALDGASWDTHGHVQNECADPDGACANLGVFLRETGGAGWKIYIKRNHAQNLTGRWRIAYALGEYHFLRRGLDIQAWIDIHDAHFSGNPYGSGGVNGCLEAWACKDANRDLYSWIWHGMQDISDDSADYGRLVDKLRTSNNAGWQAKLDWLRQRKLISEEWYAQVMLWVEQP